VNAVAPLLDAAHLDLWTRLTAWSEGTLRPRGEPASDDEARREAVVILRTLGDGGWLEPIRRRDIRALCLVREAIAADSPLADAVLAIQGLGAIPLLLAGTAAQRDQWIEPLITGRAMASFAMTEPEAGSDVASMQTRAVRDGDDWVIEGEKHLISNAGIADVTLVFAKTSPEKGSRGISLFLVPRNTPGLTFDGAQVMAAPHPLGRLRFSACRVPQSAMVGDLDRGFKLGMMTLDRLRPSVGAAACGMAARALTEAVSHARARRQFGQPLADMPLVREKIGRMATDLDAARLLVYRAAWQHDTDAARASADTSSDAAHDVNVRQRAVAAAMAKSFATEMAQRVVDESIQIAGGTGVLLGHPVERLYRAVRSLRIYEGATDIQRLIIAGGLLHP
jgi:acyl-CoA dehydrogenase